MYHIASSTCTMLLSRLQTRCKHPIYSYPNVQARLSFCTYFLLYPLVITLQDWSVNHVRKSKCQPCMEASTPNQGIFALGGRGCTTGYHTLPPPPLMQITQTHILCRTLNRVDWALNIVDLLVAFQKTKKKSTVYVEGC